MREQNGIGCNIIIITFSVVISNCTITTGASGGVAGAAGAFLSPP